MTLRLLRTSTVRPFAAVRPLHTVSAYYYAQRGPLPPNSNAQGYSTPPSQPGSASESTITQHAISPRSWDADDATASEEMIKADRGEIEDTKYAINHRSWEADNATSSEEAIKADRGEIDRIPSFMSSEQMRNMRGKWRWGRV